MKVVQVTDALKIGGAETFILRLSTALAGRSHAVTIVVLRGDLVDEGLVATRAEGVDLIRLYVPGMSWLRRIDALLFLAGSNFSLVRKVQALQLARLLRDKHPDVIQSHLITADLVVADCIPTVDAGSRARWVTTMHGDYRALEQTGQSRAARIADFRAASQVIERKVDSVVCISNPQVQQMRALMPALVKRGAITTIYNGYPPPADTADWLAPALLANIPPDGFVVGMVSRGIAEKGWDTLIDAFAQLELPNAWLVLVGEGEAVEALRRSNRNSRILFCGSVLDPLPWIARFDVACLPTRYESESLPTVVIEYLLMGKPVIATDVGEIATMLEVPGHGHAGCLIPLSNAMVDALRDRLRELYDNPETRGKMGDLAQLAARRFSMDTCVDGYLRLYAGTTQ